MTLKTEEFYNHKKVTSRFDARVGGILKLVITFDGFLNLRGWIFARSQIIASLAQQVVGRDWTFIPQCLGSSLALSDSLLGFSNWFSVI